MRRRASVALTCMLMGALSPLAGTQPALRETRVQATVEPTFRIAPLVRHYEAPRGKLLTFEFEVEALRKPTSLRIRPVGLRQEENGVIMPDETAARPQELRLETPEALELKAGERALIRGRLRVPRAECNFHSFGVLVQDLGIPVERQRTEGAAAGQTGMGIRFVTQYLLRCDVTVTSGRAPQIGKLQVTGAELLECGGRPMVRAWVFNPTDSPFEFGLRALLLSPRHLAARRPQPLLLPVRAALEGPERYIARILPGSRVRLETILDEVVFPGDYDLQIELLDGFRSVHKIAFPVSVQAGAFPAQDVQIVQVAPGVSVEPGQIELSLGRAGRRFVPLTLANSGPDAIEMHLRSETLAGDECDWFLARPDALRLESGQRRRVLVAAGPGRDDARHRYGALRVEVVGGGERRHSQALTVAVLGRSEDAPHGEVGTPRWDRHLAFIVPVSNPGRLHLGLSGILTLTDSRGRRRELSAGHGRWLLPGHNGELRFPIEPPLTAGTWELLAEIAIGESDPVRLREVIRVEKPD